MRSECRKGWYNNVWGERWWQGKKRGCFTATFSYSNSVTQFRTVLRTVKAKLGRACFKLAEVWLKAKVLLCTVKLYLAPYDDWIGIALFFYLHFISVPHYYAPSLFIALYVCAHPPFFLREPRKKDTTSKKVIAINRGQ